MTDMEIAKRIERNFGIEIDGKRYLYVHSLPDIIVAVKNGLKSQSTEKGQ